MTALPSGPGWQHSPTDHPGHWSTRCDWHPQYHVFDHDPTTADIINADRTCENALADTGAILAPGRYGATDLRAVIWLPIPWVGRAS